MIPEADVTQTERLLGIIRATGVLRARDLASLGIAHTYLSRLVARGLIERVGRGLYVAPSANATEHHSIVQAIKSLPSGVVCLLSALQFHGLTTQEPFEVWLAIDRNTWRPRIRYPALRVFRFSDAAFSAGIETHTIEGVPVQIYSPAKTVVDCFRYRNQIGLDVAVEAIRDYLRERHGSVNELWRYAKIRRVTGVIKPYLEAMI